MKILFHCGVGNTDRPGRWSTIGLIFNKFSKGLSLLGHECDIAIHPEAMTRNIKRSNTLKIVGCESLVKNINIDPAEYDIVFTWNGNSAGDREIIKLFGRDKVVFGELGYFNHYDRTCYFDSTGVNTHHSYILNDLIPTHEDYVTTSELMNQHKKEKMLEDEYVFVPLQDETDTQIKQFSPFNSMNDFLQNVIDINCGRNLILFKRHPRAPCHISRDILSNPIVHEVTEDVHHYIPYANSVFGINSTVLVETMLYHNRIISYGNGITSRMYNDDERVALVAQLYNQQVKWDDLVNPHVANKILDSLIKLDN